MQIFVKNVGGGTLTFDVRASNSVGKLKERIQRMQGIPVDMQLLIFSGKSLNDNMQSLSHYNVTRESTLHLAVRLRGGSKAAGGQAIQTGIGKKKKSKLSLLDNAMDVYVEIAIGKKKLKTSLCVNGGSECSWRITPEMTKVEVHEESFHCTLLLSICHNYSLYLLSFCHRNKK